MNQIRIGRSHHFIKIQVEEVILLRRIFLNGSMNIDGNTARLATNSSETSELQNLIINKKGR